MKQVDAFIITSTRAPGKTRKAWYQYILVCEGHTKTGDACVRNTTGHRLVLECAVAAAKELVRPAMVTFHTDCYYFANGQRQLATWKDNGWKRADGKELRNLDLWQLLEEKLRIHAVKFKVESMELYKNPNERRPC